MLVTSTGFRSRNGKSIATNKKSIIATYCRLFTLLLTVLTIGIISTEGYQTAEEAQHAFAVDIIKIVLFISACIYFFFFYGKSTKEDIILRNKVGSCIGLYALPGWFYSQQTEDYLRAFQLQYNQKYPGQDWKKDLFDKEIEQEKRRLLFAIALFNCMTYDIPENDELYLRADSVYTLEEQNTSSLPPALA
jgi:hypothetical protein